MTYIFQTGRRGKSRGILIADPDPYSAIYNGLKVGGGDVEQAGKAAEI
jgi:hypothetical protein